ncbi:MAG: hypothetical protein KF736_07980 [Acidobacteria bacterium]|nr:hypothetical protein [Acidobacteriota bacterium]MCW5948940.1 hypothetical protein [Pyrinomonadaceae bacterium]
MSSDVLYRPDCGYCEMDAAAFVEGESVDAGAFEEHLQDCSRCRNSVEEQKRFFLAIDASLRSETIPELPPSFARQVTVMAENDLGGLRRSGEKRIAFAAAAVLLLAAAALSASGAMSAVGEASGNAERAVFLMSAVFRSLYSFLIGLSVVVRSAAGIAGQDGSIMAAVALTMTIAVSALGLRSRFRRT